MSARGILVLTAILVAMLFSLKIRDQRTLEEYAEKVSKLLKINRNESAVGGDGQRTLHRLAFLLHDAETDKVNLDELIAAAAKMVKTPDAFTPVLKQTLRLNIRLGESYGIFTEPNRNLVEKGASPLINKGGHIGSTVMFHTIVPRHVAPEVTRNIANLAYTPRVLLDQGYERRLTLDDIKTAAGLFNARLISAPSFQRLIRSIRNT